MIARGHDDNGKVVLVTGTPLIAEQHGPQRTTKRFGGLSTPRCRSSPSLAARPPVIWRSQRAPPDLLE